MGTKVVEIGENPAFSCCQKFPTGIFSDKKCRRESRQCVFSSGSTFGSPDDACFRREALSGAPTMRVFAGKHFRERRQCVFSPGSIVVADDSACFRQEASSSPTTVRFFVRKHRRRRRQRVFSSGSTVVADDSAFFRREALSSPTTHPLLKPILRKYYIS